MNYYVEPLSKKKLTELVRKMLQRGIASGEFRDIDLDYAVFSITAPMIFLIMMKHSLGACVPHEYPLDPQRYLASQVDVLLRGLCKRDPAEGKQP